MCGCESSVLIPAVFDSKDRRTDGVTLGFLVVLLYIVTFLCVCIEIPPQDGPSCGSVSIYRVVIIK